MFVEGVKFGGVTSRLRIYCPSRDIISLSADSTAVSALARLALLPVVLTEPADGMFWPYPASVQLLPDASQLCHVPLLHFSVGTLLLYTLAMSNDCAAYSCVIIRSEERRVGKEGRSRWSPDH